MASALVVVFQIYVADFPLGRVDTERQTVIAGNVQAPCAFAVAGQRVNPPCRKCEQFFRVFVAAAAFSGGLLGAYLAYMDKTLAMLRNRFIFLLLHCP